MTRRSSIGVLVLVVAATTCSTAAPETAATTAAPVSTSSTAAATNTQASAPVTTVTAATAVTTTVAADPLPPHDLDDLAAIFDPMLQPLGYQVTRGSVFDRDTSEVDSAGSHLALYVEPLADISSDQFARDFPDLVKLFLPLVFDRWSGLGSFDVCQEPFGPQEQTPPSLTLIDLTRDAAAGVDWRSLDLAGLIDLHEVPGIGVWADLGVRESDTWQNAAGA